MAALAANGGAVLRRHISVVSKNFLARNGKIVLPSVSQQSKRFISEDKVTHTGQHFAEDDFRRARFVDRQKEVNPNFSQDLIAEVPPIEVDGRVASCNGGGGALGHPKVYINLDQGIPNSCGYCGLRFVQKHH